MLDPILELRHFRKQFRSYWTFSPILAVDDLTLSIEAGEAFGFLGHNGAGKTTTIKTIAGLIHKTSGEILLNGEPLRHAHQRALLGYLPEHPYFYDHLRVGETLDLFAGLAGIPRKHRKKQVAETLEQVGLASRNNSPVRSLSKGLQQRLGLAQAIIHQPKLLLLDEPFSGLDPIGRREVRELILSLRQQGCTIFISSHILSDVQDICDRVAIMAQGRLRRVFNLSETAELYGQRYVLEVKNADKNDFSDASAIEEKYTAGGASLMLSYDTQVQAEAALQRVLTTGVQLVHYHHATASLEEVFIQITNETQQQPTSQSASSSHLPSSQTSESE